MLKGLTAPKKKKKKQKKALYTDKLFEQNTFAQLQRIPKY